MMKNSDKILVFIPAYRCAAQISRVLQQFTPEIQTLVDTVIVIDNQSPDNTMEVAYEEGKGTFTLCNFIVWINDSNYGLGGSHKAAFNYAMRENFSHLIVLHGDDQANIHDILPYIRKQQHHTNDCLLGARFMRDSQLNGYSTFRTFGNKVYNLLFSIVLFHRIYDLGSGLNMYRMDSFREFYFKTFPDNLTFNYVMLMASYNRNQKVQFFPISWREEDQLSNVKLFSQAIKVLNLLLNYLFRRSKFLQTEMRE